MEEASEDRLDATNWKYYIKTQIYQQKINRKKCATDVIIINLFYDDVYYY